MPLFSLRGPQDLGSGEIFDLLPFIDWMERCGLRVVQLLPINETAIGEASPYNTLTAFAIDPAYISTWKVPDVESSPSVQTLMDTPRVRAQMRRARISGVRNRRRVYTLKLDLLELGFEAFCRLPAASERSQIFARFCRRNAWWLEQYALFRAIKERRRWTSWETWPTALRERDEAALRRTSEMLETRIRFFQYLQWVAAEQWVAVRDYARRRGVLIKGDLSFVCGRDSADVWAQPGLFDLSGSAGAPPDAFSATGQAWGLPLYDWAAMRRSGYEWWRQRARHGRDLFDLFRVDHVVGLFRTYAIPTREGGTAGFVPAEHAAQVAQGNDLLAAIVEEAGDSGVIAEDLGTVPDWVRESLTRLGIPGYKVFRWEQQHGRFIDPRAYAPLSVATTGTHDTDTLVSWWETLPVEDRSSVIHSLDLASAGLHVHDQAPPWSDELHVALLRRFYEAGSLLTIVPIQDLFGWRERINTPATTEPHNWSYRLPVETSQLDALPGVRARMALIHTMIQESGRLPR